MNLSVWGSCIMGLPMRDGTILSLSRRRGMIDWMRKVIIFLLKTKKRNRNAKEGDAQLFGESLPRSAGTFSRAGKPCRAPREHFPKRENLAALRRNIFPSGKTLPRSWGTFPREGKPCRVLRQHFLMNGYLMRRTIDGLRFNA